MSGGTQRFGGALHIYNLQSCGFMPAYHKLWFCSLPGAYAVLARTNASAAVFSKVWGSVKGMGFFSFLAKSVIAFACDRSIAGTFPAGSTSLAISW